MVPPPGGIPTFYDPDWRAFALLLQRPLIVQEASAPRDILIVCGDESVLWMSHYNPRFNCYTMIRPLPSFVRITIDWFPRSGKVTGYNRLFSSMFQAAWRVFGLKPAKIQHVGFPPESRLSN